MTTFLIMAVALLLLVVAFFLNKKGSSAGGARSKADYLTRTTPAGVSKSRSMQADSHKSPEFEYAALNSTATPIDEKNMEAGTVEMLRQKIKTETPSTSAVFPLLRLLDIPETKGEQIGAVVATSPVFSEYVLKTVNSARFNLPSRVNSVGTAILVMGYHEFKKVIMAGNLNDFLPKFRDEAQLKEYNNLWLHSAMVSTCAAHLGQNVFRRYEQELGTIGLLHDIGKYYLPLLEKKRPAADVTSSCIEEDEIYGVNHAILSSYVAQECNLSETIVNAVYYHHYPQFFPPEHIPADYRLPSFIICLADLICKAYGYHGKGEHIYPIREEYFELYEMDLKSVFSKKLEKDINRCRFNVESFIKS